MEKFESCPASPVEKCPHELTCQGFDFCKFVERENPNLDHEELKENGGEKP